MSKRYRSSSVASQDRPYFLKDLNNWRFEELIQRPNQKIEKSHDFFKQTKISTCSYIKKDGNDFKAIPYYSKPALQFNELMNKSTHNSTVNQEAYKNHPQRHSSMRKKPLQIYNPNAQRSRLQPPEYKLHYVNRSEIEIGNSDLQRKQYVTTNSNHIGNFGQTTPCSHPIILAARAKWNHHLKNL